MQMQISLILKNETTAFRKYLHRYNCILQIFCLFAQSHNARVVNLGTTTKLC